jgi:nucleoside-diphosphate-sugar epimerase
MKIVVLGSRGQIGEPFTRHLIENGHEVCGIDLLDGSENDLRKNDNLYVDEQIKKSDFVFFLAYDLGGSQYLKKYQDTFDFINNNTSMMVNVFNILKKYNKRFIFASSQMSNMSYSSYGVSKRMGELYTHALKGRVIKIWNVYGIEKDPEKMHVINDFIRKGFEEKIFNMLTNGEEEREFLYVSDCCEVLEIIMNEYDNIDTEDSLHITSFESTTIKDLAKIVENKFKNHGIDGVQIVPVDSKDTVQMDAKNKPDSFITKWWKPKVSLEDGIEKIFNKMKSNYLEVK